MKRELEHVDADDELDFSSNEDFPELGELLYAPEELPGCCLDVPSTEVRARAEDVKTALSFGTKVDVGKKLRLFEQVVLSPTLCLWRNVLQRHDMDPTDVERKLFREVDAVVESHFRLAAKLNQVYEYDAHLLFDLPKQVFQVGEQRK